ncbi:DENN domain and WD repeat-containing protein SCD1 isoform X1 [Beta vulgaris subsp. vulgaris]|uniref:DENN domain and WD repeat-containing protein SCD1 isoform X1 n=1 Tax=Beta vulgaris subsp. vulgaris TaxID=3555 RepID=UPI002036C406|nr:DENN domain and WD repeat-containing protein SCD1 isoform X1 [Beta vulgaris subsp. vulgaris]
MAPLFEYFVVCGLGPEIRTLYESSSGYYGIDCTYEPSLIDQYPPLGHSLYAPLPPELPMCVMPEGVEFCKSGFDAKDSSSYPRSYPIVLTAGDGSKIYVSCIAFWDSVDEDIGKAYGIPPNSFTRKCISLVSRIPCFCVLRDALEEIFALCFSTRGSRTPLWEVIAATVSNVPLPIPGINRVLFAINNCLFSAEAPPEYGLPHADISFEPLLQCLDAHNIIILFTAALLERRILLRSDKYTLLTLVSEAICCLIYPFQWQHVYIPLLFSKGVDYVDAPTPYIIGLHSSVDTSGLSMDGVVIVDIDHNCISTSEEIPPVPEPELSLLHDDIMKLLYPNMMHIDEINTGFGELYVRCSKVAAKPWGKGHDLQLRLIFLKFFATILSGYRNFIVNSEECSFDDQAFMMHRCRSNNQVPDPMTTQFLGSQGFSNYIGRVMSSGESNDDVLDKLIDAIGRGESPTSVFPSPLLDLTIVTIPDPTDGVLGTDADAKYIYAKFPAKIRSEEEEYKRKQILKYIKDKDDEEKGIMLDMKVKLQGLWISLLKLGDGDVILSSDEYETIFALIETDAKGIVGRALIECIREQLNSGWNGQLSEEQFIAVNELVKRLVTSATHHNDIPSLKDALEVSVEMYKKDFNNVSDYIQRHLLSQSIWEDPGFWEAFFESLMEQSSSKSSSNESHLMSQLIMVAAHMGGLGMPDTDAWPIIQNIAQINNICYDHYIQLRGYFPYIHQLQMVYWGISDLKTESLASSGLQSPRFQETAGDGQKPPKASTLARNWVRNMFGRESVLKANSFSHAHGWALETETADEIGTPRRQNLPNAGQNKIQTNVRVLRGHHSAITALHCVTKREVWDVVGDREDTGFFISGSTDCSVRIWDPSRRGSELRATLRGHTGAVRAISSDRWKVVSGSDDNSILVWDKQQFIPLEELKGHEGQISCVRMLSGDSVLSSSHDGTVKMWDARTGGCIATVARCPGSVLCMEYDDATGILAAAGRDSVVHLWDIRAGKQINKLLGHGKWVRCLRMVGDTVITGSDDWTARLWSISRGACDAVLASHGGPVLSVDYSASDRGIITGSYDGSVRFWENTAYSIKCAKEMNLHHPILSINAGEHWLGIGAADNSMFLFHRPQDRSGGWKLYRTPQFSATMVRCVASDLERKRICSGGRDGRLRLWDATINI